MLFHIAGSDPGLFWGFPVFWAWHVLKQPCAQKSRTQLMSLIYHFTLCYSLSFTLPSWSHTLLLFQGSGSFWMWVGYDAGHRMIFPHTLKCGWHDLATYLWVCALSQCWDWRTETQCPRLFTATDHVTSDQPLSLKTPSFSPHRLWAKDTVASE